jgi:hypothetical protein
VRAVAVVGLVCLAACGPAPKASQGDVTAQPWYAATVQELTGISRDAQTAYQQGRPDDASALILKGESMVDRLLATGKLTLPAAQAASDLDDLYGRMLLSNRHYGWARLQFQKNLARWKHWNPQTDDTQRRRKQAEAGIDECDRYLP